MASRLIVPFDNNPSSTTIKTSSYTIPAGKYAYVVAIHPDFSINATNLGNSASYTTTLASSNSRTLDFTSSTGFYLSNMVHTVSGAGFFSISTALYPDGTAVGGLANTLTSRNSSGTIANFFSPYVSLRLHWSTNSVSSISSSTVTVWTWHGDKNFWVPSGTVLNGSKYTVTEYNAIS